MFAYKRLRPRGGGNAASDNSEAARLCNRGEPAATNKWRLTVGGERFKRQIGSARTAQSKEQHPIADAQKKHCIRAEIADIIASHSL
jgi:hypothetical protein